MEVLIYSGLEEVELPSFHPIENYKERAGAYLEEVSKLCKEHGQGEHSGKELRFSFADGYAVYVVLSTIKQIELIHINTWDGWHHPIVNNITVKQIEEQIKRQETLKELFGK